MAISEKKRLLQDMYRPDPALASPAGEIPAPPPAARAALIERRFDRAVLLCAHLGLYLLALAGIGAIAWMQYRHYLAGLALEPTSRASRYVHDFFAIGGCELFLAFFGCVLFVLFRDSLPKGWRWIPLIALFVLIPAGPLSTVFLPSAFRYGRDVAQRRFDTRQLAIDAQDICRLFPQDANTPREINPSDGDWAKLPPYTRDLGKIESVEVYPRGVALRTEPPTWQGPGEAIIIPVPLLNGSDAADLAGQPGITQLGGEPVFRAASGASLDPLYDPAKPPPPAATMPWMR
ncbi:MAG TPA: hypothetical protein VH253_06815 [Phycisphaerae bacterium]|nr:hypothetical protein [Phycisphaerae bacterium]